jgi:hypothetical protein
MGKKSFMLFQDYREAFEALSDESAGILIKAIFAHEDGELYEIAGDLKSIFILITNQLDRNREKYIKTCEKNKKNGAKGGRPPKTQNNPTVISKTDINPSKPDTDTDTDTDTENEKDKEKITPLFRKPSIAEIKGYCSEHKYNIDAESFFNFYESNGWMVGKNKMKNWKAGIRTWDQREKEKSKTNPEVYHNKASKTGEYDHLALDPFADEKDEQ